MGPSNESKTFSRFKGFLPPLFSVIAIGLSFYSLTVSESARRDIARADAIKTEYDLFNGLARAQLEHPMMSHLFAISGETYDQRKNRIAANASRLNEDGRTTFFLEERAMAHYIFTTYEETYYIWEHAQRVGDTDRAALLREDLDYYKDQLCNPRLLWYWDVENGDKLGLLFAARDQKLYSESIIKDCPLMADPKGPFDSENPAP